MADVTSSPPPAGLDEFLAAPQPPSNPNDISTTPVSDLGGAPPGLDEFLAPEIREAKYGTAPQIALGALEGAARGIAGPLAPLAEQAIGIPAEDIRARSEVNPVSQVGGEVAGLVGSSILGVGLGAALGKVGRAAEAAAAGLGAGPITAGAVKGAVENLLFQAQSEASKVTLSDPNQSVDSAVAHMTAAGLLGAGLGGAFGAVSPLFQATKASKLGQVFGDFRDRIRYRMDNPEPVVALTDELSSEYKNITSAADEVYGASGLKAREIQSLVPKEVTPEIVGQAQGLTNELEKTIATMYAKPASYPERLVSKLEDDLSQLKSGINRANNPAEVFDAIQETKQKLQAYSKFDKFVKPVDEAYDFVQKAKQLQFAAREALEDTSVWGKAAERQKTINKAFSEYLPALKDFEKKFTSEVAGDRVIDPGKINTYINQLGKPNAEIKQQMLENFLKATRRYKEVIHNLHENLGIESPIVMNGMPVSESTLGKMSMGSKLADSLINHGLGQMAGAGIGAGVGALAGHPAIGAVAGKYALGNSLDSILPAMLAPILEKAPNGSALKSMTDLASASLKGELALNKAAIEVFKPAESQVYMSLVASERDRKKLERSVAQYVQDPDKLLRVGQSVAHYIPGHTTALATTTANIVKFLHDQKPSTTPSSPLDTPKVTNGYDKAAYNRSLDLVNQPLLVLKSIRNGTVTPKDVATIKNLYPALYQKMSQKLFDNMMDIVSKKQVVPYSTRMGLSLFLGQAMDSTMTPQGILSAQPKPQQDQPQTATQPASGPKRSTSSLSKMPSMYLTPNQAAVEDRSKRHR